MNSLKLEQADMPPIPVQDDAAGRLGWQVSSQGAAADLGPAWFE